MSGEIVIRETVPADLAAIVEVHKKGFGYDKEAGLTAELLSDPTAEPTVSLLALRDGEAVGLVDWDYLHPAPRLDDVAYALEWFGPLRRDEFVLEWHHFPVVPDRRHRVRVFLEAYGDLPAFDVAEAVAGRMEAVSALMADLAARGVEPQRTWVAEGALAEREAEIDWVRDHRALFA